MFGFHQMVSIEALLAPMNKEHHSFVDSIISH